MSAMAAATNATWKFDDGTGFAANCFPARGINRGTHEGTGSWIVAYAHQQQNKLREIFKPFAKEDLHSHHETKKDESKYLTTDFLINHHRVDSSNDLCSVNICDCELECAENTNFAQFHNVAYINASENLLSLRTFATFPNLRELEMAVNGVRNLALNPGDFPNLQVLDLSYNNLSSNDVLSLGYLSKLKVLTLTGNGLSEIHPDLSQPYADRNDVQLTRFQNLEVLLLDDNRLNDISIFAALAALPSLKELNLDKNEISLVPYLKVIGEKVHSEIHTPARATSARRSNSSRSSSKKSKRTRSSKGDTSPQPANPDDGLTTSKKSDKVTQSVQAESSFANTERARESPIPSDFDTAMMRDLSFDASSTNPPFPHLKILSLANNKIAEEEHLLAVAAWPELQALILHGNPLIRHGKGEPPLLSHYLNRRLGISIVRFKPKAPVVKPSLRIRSQRKVSSHVPKIPKQPIDAMLEALRKPAVEHAAESQHTENESDSIKMTFVSDNAGVSDQEPVFLTQMQDDGSRDTEGITQTQDSSHKAQTEEQRGETHTVADILKGATKDPEMYENLPIQGNVKMLREMLQDPLSVTVVDTPAEKRIANRVQTNATPSVRHQDIRVLPRPNARTRRKHRIDETLSYMKHKAPANLELPLIDALDHPQDRRLREDADDLLREIEAKYRVVREESLKASRQARRAVETTTAEIANLKKSLQ